MFRNGARSNWRDDRGVRVDVIDNVEDPAQVWNSARLFMRDDRGFSVDVVGKVGQRSLSCETIAVPASILFVLISKWRTYSEP